MRPLTAAARKAKKRARRAAREALRAAAKTDLGRQALASIAQAEPQVMIEALGPRVNRRAHLTTVEDWPDELESFEDLSFLFSSHQLHHAIIGMAVDEAAYLFRVARGLGPGAAVVEIGRNRGGSTLLLAAAMPEDARLFSYDIHAKETPGPSGPELDGVLGDVLDRYGLADRVELVVHDSRTAPYPEEWCELVVVDGDHSYEGARADYLHWREAIPPGGHLVFHDAAELGDLSVAHDEVARLMYEIEANDVALFRREGGAGTLLHFVRTDAAS
jgi:predicted O-methyltransferase YrrM